MHPNCSAQGGGEKVLWTMIKAIINDKKIKKDKSIEIKSPKDLPDANNIKAFFEPMADIKIFTPASYLGNIINAIYQKFFKFF